jgi:hypothetical protein
LGGSILKIAFQKKSPACIHSVACADDTTP